QQRCTCIEDAVDGIWPVFTCQDRVRGMTKKQRFEASAQQAHCLFCGYSHERISFCSGSCRDCISRSAIKNDSVDSAPWFSLARSGCKPSRQSPVTRYACKPADTAPAASSGC